jgi:hypothetical protein
MNLVLVNLFLLITSSSLTLSSYICCSSISSSSTSCRSTCSSSIWDSLSVLQQELLINLHFVNLFLLKLYSSCSSSSPSSYYHRPPSHPTPPLEGKENSNNLETLRKVSNVNFPSGKKKPEVVWAGPSLLRQTYCPNQTDPPPRHVV